MNAYLIAWLAYEALLQGIVLAKHGSERKGTVNWFAVLPFHAIGWTLLYMGGLFSQ